ncbi:MAG: bifunctional diaminohydroxyphosphoribosylaminopyrimidine deaminase/5-amino-6-(5-phosphoribosylamino)uracil reductase RibD [Saprospiraceae bacterium]|nr:bifunctional diaminohydroxyphosphoribosylaminopyrimidine deaminase/5-amino-6-(5-phosphoribosylamino)uracil reductase RibD [Saprospiraceae bacterium]
MGSDSFHPDMKYMERCFELAVKGGKYTKSNPLVGCVIVYNSRIIGEGYHERYGGKHAEINALENVPPELRHLIAKSTLYVSLEPCCHLGKTPPCAQKIIDVGIKKVVIGCSDPNPIVNGKGIQYLKLAGLHVVNPFCEERALEIISKFRRNLSKLPYVILKWAVSSDHFIGKKGEKIWLSDPATSVLTHKWRTEVDGIMVGKTTALVDNPELTARFYKGENPVRVILDGNLTLPQDLVIYKDNWPTWTINLLEDTQNVDKIKIKLPQMDDLKSILESLYLRGLHSIIIEGGATLLQNFIDLNLWNEARIIQTTKILHQGIKGPQLTGKLIKTCESASDKILFINNPTY